MSNKKIIDKWNLSPIKTEDGKIFVHPIVFDASRVLVKNLDMMPLANDDTLVVRRDQFLAFNKSIAKKIAKIFNIQQTNKKIMYLIKDPTSQKTAS